MRAAPGLLSEDHALVSSWGKGQQSDAGNDRLSLAREGHLAVVTFLVCDLSGARKLRGDSDFD